MEPSMTDASFQERMSVLKQLSKRAGIRLPSTIIPEGESLIPYGEERQRALRDEIYSLPSVAEVADELAAIRREQAPKDVPVSLQSIIMSPENGGLYGKGNDSEKALGYTEVAFAQATQFIKPASMRGGIAGTLLALPPHLRAEAFNYFATHAPEGKDVVLRTIMAPQRQHDEVVLRRTLSAVVSERYSAVEDHDLALDINAALPAGARARYTQTEGRSDLEIIWPAMSRQLKVGDIALVSLGVVNSQVKMFTIELIPRLLRVLCLNFTTAFSQGGEFEVNIRHMGDARKKFQAAVLKALKVIEPFVQAFGDAYQNKLPVVRGEVIEKAIKKFALPSKSGELIAGSWDADGDKSAGDTLAGMANAMTRASQQMPIEKAEAFEAAAGKLIRNGWEELGL